MRGSFLAMVRDSMCCGKRASGMAALHAVARSNEGPSSFQDSKAIMRIPPKRLVAFSAVFQPACGCVLAAVWEVKSREI